MYQEALPPALNEADPTSIRGTLGATPLGASAF